MTRDPDPSPSLTVTLDGEPHAFHPGATVRHLLARLDPAMRRRVHDGLAVITDADGNELGEGGALRAGGQYRLASRKAPGSR